MQLECGGLHRQPAAVVADVAADCEGRWRRRSWSERWGEGRGTWCRHPTDLDRDTGGAYLIAAGHLMAHASLQAVDVRPGPRRSGGWIGCVRGCHFGIGRCGGQGCAAEEGRCPRHFELGGGGASKAADQRPAHDMNNHSGDRRGLRCDIVDRVDIDARADTGGLQAVDVGRISVIALRALPVLGAPRGLVLGLRAAGAVGCEHEAHRRDSGGGGR